MLNSSRLRLPALARRVKLKVTKVESQGQRPLEIGTQPIRQFYERDPAGIYADRVRDPKAEEDAWERQRSNLYGLKDGFKDVRTEIWKWANEWKTRLTDDSRCYVVHGDRFIVWNFQSPETYDSWISISDMEMSEGYSRCQLAMSPTGKGLFHGFINGRIPVDGKIKRTGYCGMKCQRITKSFHRDSYLDWSQYTHLVMRVRGDGRSYMINISTCGSFDITWNDSYHYILYTRGGPYWQFVKIPFSKFLLGSKGRVQDMQDALPQDTIASLGISVGQIDGPFSLEIDYIGVELDKYNHEVFAYEMYRIPPYISNV